MQARVIFFDIGHTLVTGADRSPRRLLSARLGLSEKETRQVGQLIMTCPCTDSSALASEIAKLLPRRDPAELGEIVEAVWQEQVLCVREIPGATSLLRSLKQEGFQLGIISNIWHPFYEGFCRTCREIASMVDYSLLSYRLGCKKPFSDLYSHAVRACGHPPERCWMVGDTYELDMEPAQGVGMHTVWVLNRPEKERSVLVQLLRGEKRRPDWIAEGIDDLLPFFLARKESPR